MNSTLGLTLFVIVSAVATTALLRRRHIPVARLMEAETFDWRMARRVVGSFAVFCALAQAVAATPWIHGKFQLWGAPVLLWAVGLLYVYFWARCIALLMRKKEA